ncbi:MAG: RDD family protein [Opitutales bacterium]
MSALHSNDPRPPKLPEKELRPETALDSVFCDGGPMPPARLWLRGLAFVLDFILVTAVASVIIWKIALPQSHPGAFHELMIWTEEVLEWMGDPSRSEDEGTVPKPGEELQAALTVAHELQLLTFWIYFALGEAFFGGSSLGKRICRLRSMSTVTLGPPPVLSGIVRGGLKTILLFWIFPILFAANFIALFFNRRRQLGHDWFSRTAVVDEKYLNLAQPK